MATRPVLGTGAACKCGFSSMSSRCLKNRPQRRLRILHRENYEVHESFI